MPDDLDVQVNSATGYTSTPMVDFQRPWLGLLPFKEIHRTFFFGRDGEVTEILGRIRENPLTVLFGQSGLGKTSLLGAAVVPALREDRFAPILIRLDYGANSVSLLDQTRTAFQTALPTLRYPEDAPSLTLWELFHRLPLILPPDGPIPVLIFDQFEEIFTLAEQIPGKEQEAKCWLEEMADLIQNRPPVSLEERFAENRRLARNYDFQRTPVRIVFALREDYLSHLEGWKARLPLLTQNRMALRPFTGVQALEAVLGAASLGESSLLTREVAAKIVRTVARAPDGLPLAQVKAVPPLLSLLCEQLNAARIAAGEREISSSMVLNQSEDILQRFYTESFHAFPVSHRETIRALLEDPPMVTEGGYRNSLVREDAEAHLMRLGMPNAAEVFDLLIQRRLIVGEEKERVQRIEITHDVLVPLLVRSRKERRDRLSKELAERELAREAAKTRRRQLFAAVALTFLDLTPCARSPSNGPEAARRAKSAQAVLTSRGNKGGVRCVGYAISRADPHAQNRRCPFVHRTNRGFGDANPFRPFRCRFRVPR